MQNVSRFFGNADNQRKMEVLAAGTDAVVGAGLVMYNKVS